MIKTQDRTPEVYSSESRDFQLIGRLFDATFNSPYVASSTIKNINNEKIDYRFTELACKTLGFDSNSLFSYNELIAVLASFNHLVKYKGTKHAIEDAIKLLINSQHLKETYYINWKSSSKSFTVMLPKDINNTKLLDDLFDYLLPFGWTYEIALVGAPEEATRSTQIAAEDRARVTKVTNVETSASDYIKFNNQGGFDGIESMDYIGQVPVDEKFISPAVGLDNIQSTDPDSSTKKKK